MVCFSMVASIHTEADVVQHRDGIGDYYVSLNSPGVWPWWFNCKFKLGGIRDALLPQTVSVNLVQSVLFLPVGKCVNCHQSPGLL